MNDIERKRRGPKYFIGMKFKNVEIIDYIGYEKGSHFVKCRCNCGNIIERKRYSDINDSTKCKECRATRYKTEKEKALYVLFKGIKNRCYNKNDNEFKNYGGKGIYICKEWLDDRYEFVKWSINNGYEIGLTIDRIDSNKEYSPNNCRWITRSLNSTYANNRRQYKLPIPVLATSPNGEEYLIEYDLKRFCDKHSLDVSSVRKVLQGKYKQHKGWKFVRKQDN